MRQRVGMVNLFIVTATVTAVQPAGASQTVLSVRDNTGSILGGLRLLDGDIVSYDQTTDTAGMVLAESAFTSGSIDVNAVHMMRDGTIVFSTVFNGAIGGIEFGDGDVVAYDPVRETATILLSETLWSGTSSTTDVNAVSVRDDGRIVLSHVNDSDSLGGLTFSDGDVVEYDPAANTATLLVAESDLFDDGNGDVDGLHVLPGDRLLLTFQDDEMISGVAVRDGDVIEYDIVSGAVTMYLSEDVFASPDAGNDVNAISAGGGCAADVDASGDVGFTDLLSMMVNWGPCPPQGVCDADLDASGAVDFTDLLLLVDCWGPCS